jgi:hypothetical protein
MPILHYTRGAFSAPRRVFLAIPTYVGQLPSAVVACLSESYDALRAASIAYDLCIESYNCHVDDARNSLVREFMRTDCTDLVFLDADVIWRPDDLVKLLNFDHDIVAGVYPKKQDEPEFPVFLPPGKEHWSNADGLIEVDGAPTGFMRIRRNVFEEMLEAHKATRFKGQDYKPDDPLYTVLFERVIEEGRRWSGDYAFCRKWRKLGGKVFVDPEMHFGHEGIKQWKGCLGDHLRKKHGILDKRVIRAIKRLKAGDASNEVFIDLVAGWANPFSAKPELLMASYVMAKQHKTVLEMGSGLTTLVMAAAGARVESLEHDIEWHRTITKALKDCDLSATVHYAPLTYYGDDLWYSLPNTLPVCGLVVCDGPPRHLANRALMFDQLPLQDALILIDDTDDSHRAWAKATGRELHALAAEISVSPPKLKARAA